LFGFCDLSTTKRSLCGVNGPTSRRSCEHRVLTSQRQLKMKLGHSPGLTRVATDIPAYCPAAAQPLFPKTPPGPRTPSERPRQGHRLRLCSPKTRVRALAARLRRVAARRMPNEQRTRELIRQFRKKRPFSLIAPDSRSVSCVFLCPKLLMRKVGLEPTRPFGHQILSLDSNTDSETDQQLTSATSEQTGKNPQPRRNPKTPKRKPSKGEPAKGGEQ